MSMPMTSSSRVIAPEGERHDVLKMILEWIADRFADAPSEVIDTSIDWEDGEEHDEPHGPLTL
jgi:hypothetical protein